MSDPAPALAAALEALATKAFDDCRYAAEVKAAMDALDQWEKAKDVLKWYWATT